MGLKTDTILLKYTLHQFQYFITTYLSTVEIYQQMFQANIFKVPCVVKIKLFFYGPILL